MWEGEDDAVRMVTRIELNKNVHLTSMMVPNFLTSAMCFDFVFCLLERQVSFLLSRRKDICFLPSSVWNRTRLSICGGFDNSDVS